MEEALVDLGHALERHLAEARHRPRLEAERHVHGVLVVVDHGRALAEGRQRVALLPRLLQERLLGVEHGLRLGGVALPEPEVVGRGGVEAADVPRQLDPALGEAVERPRLHPEADGDGLRLAVGARRGVLDVGADLAVVVALRAQRRLEPRHVVERAAADHELARGRLLHELLGLRDLRQQALEVGRQVAVEDDAVGHGRAAVDRGAGQGLLARAVTVAGGERERRAGEEDERPEPERGQPSLPRTSARTISGRGRGGRDGSRWSSAT